ncbi:HNH endonuclease [Rhizobium lentis]|uniref:HNH endonuclease n=1 Tax=Rhizobium lentis TaxID=1138194 RepID=UPI00287FBFEA|nr:hypothetical protein [Rhizobium lentis]
MRTVEEWIGKTDHEKVPPRVRLRVFEKFGGICQLSSRKIMPGDEWDIDHIKAIWRGGGHRESNLHPALREKHREKSGDEHRAGEVRQDPQEASRHLAAIESQNP